MIERMGGGKYIWMVVPYTLIWWNEVWNLLNQIQLIHIKAKHSQGSTPKVEVEQDQEQAASRRTRSRTRNSTRSRLPVEGPGAGLGTGPGAGCQWRTRSRTRNRTRGRLPVLVYMNTKPIFNILITFVWFINDKRYPYLCSWKFIIFTLYMCLLYLWWTDNEKVKHVLKGVFAKNESRYWRFRILFDLDRYQKV